ncbi:MAG: LamG-like jellyroll fold domain-containing protein [Candidatus Paceibacterota bacterium]|jgi:prepilin-type N-terminal cleavage/methylation domain-containing protein
MNKLLKQAFTLIELLVVIAIIGILSGLIVVSMSGVTKKANIAKVKVFSNSLRNALMINLVSEYKLDGNTNDSWGPNGASFNGGTATYKPEAECISGQCLNFDGSNDFLSVPANVNTSLQNNINTVSMWVYIRSLGPNYYAELYSVTGGNRTGIKWINDRIGIDNNGIFYDYWVPVSFTFDSWNYVVVEINRIVNKGKVYANGVYKGQTGAWPSYSPTANNPYIGSNSLTGNVGDFLNGIIDDVRIYNEAVPQALIKEQYYTGLNNLFLNGAMTQKEYYDKVSTLIAEK